MKNNKTIINHLLILFLATLLIIVLGFLYADTVSIEKDKNIKKDLASRLETIVNSLDAERFSKLTYTPDDNTKVDYQVLRNKLIKNAQINQEYGVKWIYTMVPKDEQIIFVVDSITDSNHSEPGDVYVDVDPEFKNAFDRAWSKGESSIVGPYSDHWGRFISVIAPLRSSETGEILNVIALDADYENFYIQQIKNTQQKAYTIFTILFLLIFILIYIFIIYLIFERRKINIEKIRLDYGLEGAGDGLWDWNIKTNQIFLSHRWKEMLGYSDEEIKNEILEWRNKIHPKDYPLVSKKLKNHVHGITTSYEDTHRVLCKNGNYKWILSRGKIMSFDSAGNPERMVGTHTDMDEFKKIEGQLSQKVLDIEKIRTATLNILEDIAEEKNKFLKISNKLKLATESGNIGILELDLKENTVMGDDIASSMYGLPLHGLQNISFEQWLTYVHPEDVEKVKKAVELCIKNNSNFNMIFRILLPNKKIAYIKGYASIERDEKGNFSKLVGVNIDITKDYEIDRAKTEFVSLASHQLKTPVGAISWNLEMLMDGDYGKLTKKQIEIIQETYQMNRRMADLVNGFLNISRIELGTFSIDPVVIDYKTVCEEVLTELKLQIKEKKHVITKKYDELTSQTEGDPRLLHVLFQNILTNAIKYTPNNGNIDIYIGTNKNGILIKISNDGHIIPLEDQPKIFEKMFRASDAQSMDPNGNGLGLYLLKSIVEQAGGKIWFESKEGIGTAFYVSFPLTGMKGKKGTTKII